MGRFVKIFQDFVCMMGFVVKDIYWRCVDCQREHTQQDREMHASEIGNLGPVESGLNSSI